MSTDRDIARLAQLARQLTGQTAQVNKAMNCMVTQIADLSKQIARQNAIVRQAVETIIQQAADGAPVDDLPNSPNIEGPSAGLHADVPAGHQLKPKSGFKPKRRERNEQGVTA